MILEICSIISFPSWTFYRIHYHVMGDPPRAFQPGKPLESVCYRTFVLWPLESGNLGSLSFRAIAPRADRGKLS